MTFKENIYNDIKAKGSQAGEVTLLQKKATSDKLDLSDFDGSNFNITDYDVLPQNSELLENEELKSQQNDSKVHRVFVFEKIAINGRIIDCPRKLMIFIRETIGTLHKLLIVVQAKRRYPEYDIDNVKVFECIDNHINNEGYVIDALDYDEESGILNFIIYRYGTNAKLSEVYREFSWGSRELKGFDNNDILKWNDIEFSIQCAYLIRKYRLVNQIRLLLDVNYCRKRFDMSYKNSRKEREYFSFLSIINSNQDIYMDKKICMFDEMYYLATTWESSEKRLLFWNWLLNNISQVSNDVSVNYTDDEVKFLKIPESISIDTDEEILELDYKVKVGKENENFKDFLIEHRINMGDELILVDKEINRLRAYYLYKLKYFKPKTFLLEKGKDIINMNKEQELIEMARKELQKNNE